VKVVLFVFLSVLTLASFVAQAAPWQPANGNVQIPIWPDSAPGNPTVNGPEDSDLDTGPLVAGKHWTWVSNVVKPTITVYSPKGKNSGAAAIVFPGGGYDVLAIDLEGTEVCDWLTSKGITCVLLKYRVPHSGPQWNSKCNCNVYPENPSAVQDAQRTVGYVRFHAVDWKIDPNKIGVIGFSAGGHLVAAISTNFQKRLYTAVDAADKESCRPDFAIALYPGHLSDNHKTLNKDIHVTAKTPPTLLIQSVNDPVDPVEYSTVYFAALKTANVPVEMHLFSQGAHAFGLRPTELPITKWPSLVEPWLVTLGMISK
jgi:acetyl esterase/lipase